MDDITTCPVSNLLFDQENLRQYCEVGYHPVSIGDKFKDSRYTVAHKLGWEGFSTVWLAKDNLHQSWVALKITTAKTTSLQKELTTLQTLQQRPNFEYVPKLIDAFVHEGPNGHHSCIVTEMLGPSIDIVVADYRDGGDQLSPDNILRLAKQLLQAIAALHEAVYAHGDISCANVVFTASNLTTLSDETFFDILGRPELATLLRKDRTPLGRNFPNHLVRKVEWVGWTDEDEEDIRLIDFGEAFPLGNAPARIAQPTELRVPETILTDHFDHEVDLWRAGCVIYALIFASYPFMYLGDENALIAQMIDFVEQLPKEWEAKWEEKLAAGGRTYDSEFAMFAMLRKRFVDTAQDPDLMPLLPVIEGLMRFRPSDRISAREALQLLE